MDAPTVRTRSPGFCVRLATPFPTVPSAQVGAWSLEHGMGSRRRSDVEWSYEVLRSAIHATNCGLIARDGQGRIRFINDTALHWLGYERGEVLGRGLEMLVPPELRENAREEQKASDEGDLRARLTVLQRKNSTSFPVVAIPNRIENTDDGSTSTYAILVDLSSIQTAKRSGESRARGVRGRLEEIAFELQTIGLSSEVPGAGGLSLDHALLGELSAREKEILVHLVSGERVPAIATLLHIHANTVRNHLKSIYRKVGVGNQSELIRRVRSLSSE